MELRPLRFISEQIQVEFDEPPLLEKQPHCPSGFRWTDARFSIVETLAEWHEFERKGRMASNMRPDHASVAAQRGSWGVGRFYFRVRTGDGRYFELYYDRAPKNIHDRKGGWFLYRELTPEDTGSERDRDRDRDR